MRFSFDMAGGHALDQSCDDGQIADPLLEDSLFLDAAADACFDPEQVPLEILREGHCDISESATMLPEAKRSSADGPHGPLVSQMTTSSSSRALAMPIPIADLRTSARTVDPSACEAAALSRYPVNGVEPFSRKRTTPTERRPETPVATGKKAFSPVRSLEEDSDHSGGGTSKWVPTRLKDLPSASGSPLVRPSSACSQGGITAMRLQLESLNLDRVLEKPWLARSHSLLGSQTPNGNTDVNSDVLSDGEKSPMTTYEVQLEHDFVSPELSQRPLYGALEGGLVRDSFSRKMCASDFEPLRCLGKGTYGTVLLVRHIASGRLYAQKQFRKASLTVHKKLIEQTKAERVILESVNRHPFVVKLYYAFQDHEKLYLILEYAQGGELFTHLAMERMFSEDTAAFYMAEMVLALEHLHHNVGVVYRDLKPENCLLDAEGHLLLTDFGLSKVAVDEGDCCRSILGTVEYMAPEVVQGKNYGMAVDWWSLGALGFDLLTGSPPFQGNNHAKIQEKIIKQKVSLPYFLSPDAKDLLTRLLRKDPRKRLGGNTLRDLQTIKKHRFFRKIDWTALERRDLEPPIRPLITDPALAENFAVEFTDLALSPVLSRFEINGAGAGAGAAGVVGPDPFSPTTTTLSESNNPFGGFSFVASSSLLECGNFGF